MKIQKISFTMDSFPGSQGNGVAIPRTGLLLEMKDATEKARLFQMMCAQDFPAGLTLGDVPQGILVDASPPGRMLKETDIIDRLEPVIDFLQEHKLLDAEQSKQLGEIYVKRELQPKTIVFSPQKAGLQKDKPDEKNERSR